MRMVGVWSVSVWAIFGGWLDIRFELYYSIETLDKPLVQAVVQGQARAQRRHDGVADRQAQARAVAQVASDKGLGQTRLHLGADARAPVADAQGGRRALLRQLQQQRCVGR